MCRHKVGRLAAFLPFGRKWIFSPDLEMVKIYQPSLFLLAAGLAVEILEWVVGCK